MVGQLDLRDRRRGDGRQGGLQRLLDKGARAAPAADVVDQQPDFQPVGDVADALEHVGPRHVERQGADLDPRLGADSRGGLGQGLRLAGDEDEVNPRRAE